MFLTQASAGLCAEPPKIASGSPPKTESQTACARLGPAEHDSVPAALATPSSSGPPPKLSCPEPPHLSVGHRVPPRVASRPRVAADDCRLLASECWPGWLCFGFGPRIKVSHFLPLTKWPDDLDRGPSLSWLQFSRRRWETAPAHPRGIIVRAEGPARPRDGW